MNDLDALVRGGAIGITLLLTAVFLRAWPNRSRAWRHAMRPRHRDSASYGTEAQATCGGLGDRRVKAGVLARRACYDDRIPRGFDVHP